MLRHGAAAGQRALLVLTPSLRGLHCDVEIDINSACIRVYDELRI
jgi:hypothetical protein